MIEIGLLLLRWLWPFLLLGGAYLWADHGWCNAACAKRADVIAVLQAQLDQAQIAYKRQQQAYQAAAQQADEKAQRERMALEEKYEGVHEKIAADPALRPIVLPIAAGLLDAARLAEPQAPASQEPPATAPATTNAAALEAYTADLLHWAAVCRARDQQWREWYDSLPGDAGVPARPADPAP